MQILESPITALICAFSSETELKSYLAARPAMRVIARVIYTKAKLHEVIVLIEQHADLADAAKARKARELSDRMRIKSRIRSNNAAAHLRQSNALSEHLRAQSLVG